jgi:hypothetical protein
MEILRRLSGMKATMQIMEVQAMQLQGSVI